MTDLGTIHSADSPHVPTLLTFLIADVRGYTRFTAQHGDEAAAKLATTFATIAREMAAARDGEVIELRGDEALAVFPSARQALRAALDLQERFAQETAADSSLPLNVGIGLDAGDAIPVEGGYRGGALNLAARLCSIAGAGEVFASETVIGLARKTEGVAFLDRGEVTLKGLSAPVRVIQIAPEGELPSELPPLQPILVTHPTNLPDEPTPFIGREREIDQIVGLLKDPHIRLVTLTGPGGTGKTRLALQVGDTLLHDFQDGVFFVNLAPPIDPTLVPSTIAEVLGVKETAGRDLVETLTDYLTSKHLLLVLDNYEHLLDASRVVSSLLDRCRELHVLVTSRIPLHLTREHEYAVPPLSVPDPRHLPDLGTLSQYEAVALFVDRARAVRADFQVTNENAPAVAEICSRLDGLPLAIELAAARIKLFPPQALLQRLSSRLTLLTGGARDRPGRQQTLRNTIDWSYSLLSSAEQTLFAHLSVFAGGCTFEAAEAICATEGDLDLLDGMTSLVDKSLLRQKGEEEPRFVMLETIREYAAERLAVRDDGRQLRQRHAEYYLGMMEEAVRQLSGPEQARWLDRLEEEHDNLRVALAWTRDSGNVETGLRVASGLVHYWHSRGHYAEGKRWLKELLTVQGHDGQAPSPRVRMRALYAAAVLIWRLGGGEQARAWAEDALRLAREVGDRRDLASSLGSMAWLSREWGDYARAVTLAEEGLSLYRELGDRRGIADALLDLGDIARDRGDPAGVEACCQESLATYRELGDSLATAFCLHNLGRAAHMAGDDSRATALCQESLALVRQLGDADTIADVLTSLGLIAHDQGDDGEAARLFTEGLIVLRTGPMLPLRAAHLLEGMAGVAAARREGERAARLFGAADAVRTRMEVPVMPANRARYERDVEAARKELGEQRFTAAWYQGRSMSLEAAVADALDESAEVP